MNTDLETKLSKKIRKNRTIILAVAVAFLIICIVFAVIRENTKEVIEYESGIPFIGGYKSVVYNPTYSMMAGLAFIVFMMALVILFLDFIFTRVNAVDACGSKIILYRGPLSVVLYIDGKEVSRSRYYLEGRLADGSSVTVSLSRNMLYAHMSFSNGHTPIDI